MPLIFSSDLSDTLIAFSEFWGQYFDFGCMFLDSLLQDAAASTSQVARSSGALRVAGCVSLGLLACPFNIALRPGFRTMFGRLVMCLDSAPRTPPSPKWVLHIMRALIAYTLSLGSSCADLLPRMSDFWSRHLSRSVGSDAVASWISSLQQVVFSSFL